MGCSYNTKARRLGYKAADFNGGFYLLVNPRIEGDVVHHGGKAFKKGRVYDAVSEGIPKRRLEKMLKLKMNGTRFFIKTRAGAEIGG
jgi:hypothetical protein